MKIPAALLVLAVTAPAFAQGPRTRAKPEDVDARRGAASEETQKEGTAGRDRLDEAFSGAKTSHPPGGADAAGDPDDAAAPPLEVPVASVAPPPFAGTPRQGLAEVRRLARGGDAPLAAALADDLVGRVRPADERLLAELRYAGGLAHSMALERQSAAVSFRSAAALAGGDPELRRDALYNQAVERLLGGELLRENIMEIAVQDLKVGIAGPEDVGLGGDTLPAAKQSYLQARELLADRVRLDWRDEDARANLEFVQRRLDELAEIEANREEADSQNSSEGMETEKTKEGDGATKGEEESDQEQEEDGNLGQSQDSEEDSVAEADPSPGEGAEEGDDMPDPSAEEREGEEQQKQEQAETGDENEELESDEGGATQDETMSRQEARLVLDRLNELDEKAKRLRAALYKTRMVQVPRDW